MNTLKDDNSLAGRPQPPPWHFSIGETQNTVQRKLADGIQANIVSSEQLMVSVVRLEPNARGKMHSHPEEQWGVLLEGSCVRLQGDEAVQMKVGDFWCTLGGIEHTLVAGPDGATTLEIFCPPRKAYLEAGQGFGGYERNT
jgi:quercetin dioxygenase-like cupin family protein